MSEAQPQAIILAIANQKGGVGKTTTTVTLGAALARKKKRVLLLDLDPHGCASVHMRLYPEEVEHSVHDIFAAPPTEWGQMWETIRVKDVSPNIDLVPASIRLSELEVDLQGRSGKGTILQQALQPMLHSYDYILLDCPPHVGILLVNALIAAHLVIIPIQTDFLALHGLKLLIDTIKVLNKVLPQHIVYKVLPTLFDRRAKACAKVLELLRSKMQAHMFSTVISMDTRFRDASAKGRIIYEIAPYSRGARAYEALAKEILAL